MSMIGNYMMIDENIIDEIRSGNIAIDSILYDEEISKDEFLDIDKSWHAIHYLICQDEWDGELPLFNIVLGRKEINEEDIGYGPARFLSVAEVKETYNAIEPITRKELYSKFDWKDMNKHEIYPGYQGEEDFEYIGDYFEEVKEFFRKAAHKEKAMILYIN